MTTHEKAQQHASAIAEATRVLNLAIEAARRDNVKTEVTTIEYNYFESRTPGVQVVTQASYLLGA